METAVRWFQVLKHDKALHDAYIAFMNSEAAVAAAYEFYESEYTYWLEKAVQETEDSPWYFWAPLSFLN